MKSNHFYESILSGDVLFQKSITPMMLVDSSRTIVKTNQQFCKLFGYEADEIIGKKTVILTPSEEHFRKYAGAYEKTRDGSIESSELLYKRSDYSLFWVKLTGIPIEAGSEKFVLWSFDDITQEVYAREDLKRSYKELEVIFNRTNVGLMYVVDDVIQKVNHVLLTMLDKDETIIGQKADTIFDCFDTCKDQNKKKVKRIARKDDEVILIEREIIQIDRGCYLIILSDITAYLKEKESLTLLAEMDGLTKVYNRRAFTNITQRVITQLQYEHISFVMLDVDHFKPVNDRWGHDVGDNVLIELTALIKEQLRQGEVIGRMGGDEFVILLPLDKEQAINVCERIRDVVTKHRFTENEIELSVSMGLITCHLLEVEDFESLYRAADKKLYDSKRMGRNRLAY